MPHSHVTIRDVTVHAGVSHQTISRIIDNNTRVLPKTRMHIKKSITELGYRLNTVAQLIAHGRTRALAYISPNLTDYTFAASIKHPTINQRVKNIIIVKPSSNTLSHKLLFDSSLMPCFPSALTTIRQDSYDNRPQGRHTTSKAINKPKRHLFEIRQLQYYSDFPETWQVNAI